MAVWWAVVIVGVVALVQSIGVYYGSALDGTLRLPNEGDGFLEHYGVWAILITDPMLIVAAGLAHRRFLIALDTLPLAPKKESKLSFETIVKPHLEFLNMRSNSKYVYTLLVVVGALSWLNNIRQTIEPSSTYGNDVFDSYQYFWGYYANKLNLFSSWVVVYPLVGFQLVSMSVSIRLILQKLTISGNVAPNVLHPDGCYGMFNLGVLNVVLIFPYFLSYCVVFALLLTHENQYFSIIAPLVGLTVVMVSASFLTVGPITRLGRTIRDKTFRKLESKSKDYNGNNRTLENRFAFERLCYSTARATPYSRWAQALINLLRVAPVVLTAYRLIG